MLQTLSKTSCIHLIPGVIINQPHGQDVYANVPKDYVGRNVTPEVFINVLLGNATYLKDKGSGKVGTKSCTRRLVCGVDGLS